ncbi:MAG: hypothetical protein QM703_24665 [Gemmatales bacterium]
MSDGLITYDVEYTETQHLKRVFKIVEGTKIEVAINPGDQDYCDFLTWWAADTNRLPFAMSAQGHTFFSDPNRLAEYCRLNDIHLFVSEKGINTAGRDHNILGQYYDCITTASLLPPQKKLATLRTAHYSTVKACIPQKHLDVFNAAILDEESLLRKFSTLPLERTFVYIDISEYSRYSALEQSYVLKDLLDMSSFVEKLLSSYGRLNGGIEAKLCLGDGYIYVFRSVLEAFLFSVHLASLIELAVSNNNTTVPIHFRIGVHSGDVYFFHDPGRNGWNYCGDGINGGCRVLQAIEKDKDDVVFISSQSRNRLLSMIGEKSDEMVWKFVNTLVNRGRRADKHGNLWRVYEVSHTASIWKEDLLQYKSRRKDIMQDYGNWIYSG